MAVMNKNNKHSYDNLSQISQCNAAVQLKFSSIHVCKTLKNCKMLTKREKQNKNTKCNKNQRRAKGSVFKHYKVKKMH